MSEQEIQVQIDEAASKGSYANFAVVAHSENEFIFDFIFVHPPQGRVVARIITSPNHAKRFFKALGDNLAKYEGVFGAIPEGKQPPPSAANFKISPN